MENNTKTIDIVYFLRYLRSKAVILLVSAIVFAGLIAGYSYKKQKGSVNKSEQEILKSVMKQNHDAFFFTNVKYSDAEKPEKVYNSSAKLYVEFDYSDLLINEDVDNLSFQEISKSYENDVCTIIKDGKLLSEVIEELGLRNDEDMKDITPDNLQWLINRNFTGAHVMNVVISDVNPERAKKICDKVIEKVNKKIVEYPFVKSSEIISEGTLPENGYYTISTGGNSIDKKKLVKFGIVGMMIGIILAAAVLFVLYAFTDKIYSEADINDAGLKLTSGIRRKNIDYKRLAGSINLYDAEKVLLVSVDGKTDAKKDAEEISKELKTLGSGVKLTGTGSFLDDTDALAKVKEYDSVIYLVKYGKTRLRTLKEAEEILSRSAKSLGVIVR
ncbi:MAG: hypothetical protein IJJ89_02335 [Eubacterium sp.]|nr:hypothetical protein [Eubacterium sp.]